MPRTTARSLFTCLLLSCATPHFDPTPVPLPEALSGVTSPFLHAEGPDLFDGEGKRVSLRAVNVGGWLLSEGWLWGGGWQSETTILTRLATLLDAEEADAFRRAIHDTFITDEDLAEIARLGFNAVRVPFNHTLLEDDDAPFQLKSEGFATLDRLLDACATHHLWCLLDLHAAPGGQSDFYVADPDPTLLWKDAVLEERTVALWEAIAARYADHPGLGGYDLLNEPSAPDGTRLVALYERIIDAIRRHDARHLVVLEGANVAQDFDVFPRKLSWNQAYSFHQYSWVADARADELDRYADWGRRHDVPTFAGEFGLSWVDMIASWVTLFEAPERGLDGWAYWSWKMAPGHTPGLLELPAELPKWTKVRDWIASDWNARPTVDETRAGLLELLDAVRFERCTLDVEVATALLPPPSEASGSAP